MRCRREREVESVHADVARVELLRAPEGDGRVCSGRWLAMRTFSIGGMGGSLLIASRQWAIMPPDRISAIITGMNDGSKSLFSAISG